MGRSPPYSQSFSFRKLLTTTKTSSASWQKSIQEHLHIYVKTYIFIQLDIYYVHIYVYTSSLIIHLNSEQQQSPKTAIHLKCRRRSRPPLSLYSLRREGIHSISFQWGTIQNKSYCLLYVFPIWDGRAAPTVFSQKNFDIILLNIFLSCCEELKPFCSFVFVFVVF